MLLYSDAHWGLTCLPRFAHRSSFLSVGWLLVPDVKLDPLESSSQGEVMSEVNAMNAKALCRDGVGALGARMSALFVSAALCGCSSASKLDPTVAETYRGSTYVTEATDPQTLRVLLLGGSVVAVGQCASFEGGLLQRFDCLPAAQAFDLKLDANLGRGRFYEYSSVAEVRVESQVQVAGQKVSGSFYTSRHHFVFEWSRSRYDGLQQPQAIGKEHRRPVVVGADIGVAVRLHLDVRARTSSLESALTFGVGDLSAALATNEATVDIRYDSIGVTKDMMTCGLSPMFRVASVQEFLDAKAQFVKCSTAVDEAWNAYVNGTLAPAPAAGVPAAAAPPAGTFSPSVLAYYVGNVPAARIANDPAFVEGYNFGINATFVNRTCAAATKDLIADMDQRLNLAYESPDAENDEGWKRVWRLWALRKQAAVDGLRQAYLATGSFCSPEAESDADKVVEAAKQKKAEENVKETAPR